MQHRDSLGNDMIIGPGTVNLMTAGSGIVHSERSDSESRTNISQLFGIQSWLALPRAMEETAPSFDHYGESSLPEFSIMGSKAGYYLVNGLDSKVWLLFLGSLCMWISKCPNAAPSRSQNSIRESDL